MIAENITENVERIKSLIEIYSKSANSQTTAAEMKNVKREMKVVKEDILKLLLQTKKEVRKQERKVLPATY